MMQMLGEGFITSLQIFALTLVGALPLGVVVVALRMCRFAPVRLIARAYISVMRGTPLMLQMFAIYSAPFYVFGVQLTPSSKWQAAIIAFIVNYAAYFASTTPAAVPSRVGSTRPPRSWGTPKFQTLAHIVVPQVVKRIMPAIGNEVITLVKDTSLAFAIGVGEMFSTAKALVASQVSMVPFSSSRLPSTGRSTSRWNSCSAPSRSASLTIAISG